MRKTLIILSTLLMGIPVMFGADVVTQIPMETNGKAQISTLSGKTLAVRGKHTDENINGAKGGALRFDGYSTYVNGDIEAFNPNGSMSVSMWVAPETYPIIDMEKRPESSIMLAGTYDESTKNGWAFNLGFNGVYSFSFFTEGWPVTVEASDMLSCYEWSYLVAVIDMDMKIASLYRNGEKVGERNTMNSINNNATTITIGRNAGGSQFGNYFIDTFNGLIDDITVYNGKLTVNEISSTPENEADLSIPTERFEGDLLRPKYHGMPAANWTNECHGMTYSNGKYHLFFQKNANGPYMSRLHWGHISSENLYDWQEEKIAIAPSESYDIKGCWSGCVFTDEEITGGVPNIIYTGVDYQKAYMVQAAPLDDDLIEWEKKGVIINGKPSGLSDDFRDPYFFRNGDDAYIIVGSSKDNLGVATLHKYNKGTKTWSNDGKVFYQAKDLNTEGRFWEMPNVTKMENGKWLFTVTPQGQGSGVHTIYWTGDINSEGQFIPDNATPKNLELISKDGFGMLSPTIYQYDEKTIMLGIVPDKLSIGDNSTLGWAHLYSFPREISLNEKGELVQKPYSGLEDLRAEEGYSESNFMLDGTKLVTGIGGRQFEVKGAFKVGNEAFGIKFFKNARGSAVLSYTPAINELKLDLSSLNRIVNDKSVYDGIYKCTLPQKPESGSVMNINVFVDGSIIDIFVNDTFATSVRIFPNAPDANGVEVFADGGSVEVESLEGWLLGDATYEDNGSNGGGDDAGVDGILDELPAIVNVYNVNGVIIKRSVNREEALKGLPKGIYIVGDQKIVI